LTDIDKTKHNQNQEQNNKNLNNKQKNYYLNRKNKKPDHKTAKLPHNRTQAYTTHFMCQRYEAYVNHSPTLIAIGELSTMLDSHLEVITLYC